MALWLLAVISTGALCAKYSFYASGRIRSHDKAPNGKICPCKDWYARWVCIQPCISRVIVASEPLDNEQVLLHIVVLVGLAVVAVSLWAAVAGAAAMAVVVVAVVVVWWCCLFVLFLEKACKFSRRVCLAQHVADMAGFALNRPNNDIFRWLLLAFWDSLHKLLDGKKGLM